MEGSFAERKAAFLKQQQKAREIRYLMILSFSKEKSKHNQTKISKTEKNLRIPASLNQPRVNGLLLQMFEEFMPKIMTMGSRTGLLKILT